MKSICELVFESKGVVDRVRTGRRNEDAIINMIRRAGGTMELAALEDKMKSSLTHMSSSRSRNKYIKKLEDGGLLLSKWDGPKKIVVLQDD